MKSLTACFAFLFFSLATFASDTDSVINELNIIIKQSMIYDNIRLKEIERLKNLLSTIPKTDVNKQYDICLRLYDEFKYYNYDSAFNYANKLQNLAASKKDASLLADAKIKMVFVMLSGGMFKESFDSLNELSIKGVADNVKAEYYSLKARAYYDLADFDNDNFYTPLYNTNANLCIDSALSLYPLNSFEHFYYSGLKNLKKGKTDSALINLNSILNQHAINEHEMALVTSMLGGIYNIQGNMDKERYYLALAAIADIKSATKETTALMYLAGIEFKNGAIENAAQYVQKANEDARFYNARLRKVQIGGLLPMIEGEMIKTIKSQNQKLQASILSLVFLIIILAAFAIIIYNQVKKLKVAKGHLLEANLNQQRINDELADANQLKEKYNNQLQQKNVELTEVNNVRESYNRQLKEINRQLAEANKIKEEYIGRFFSLDTHFFGRIERLLNKIEKKITERKWEEVRLIVKTIDIKKEKEELLKDFDKIFINLFPNFVQQFNTLFNAEEKVNLKDGQLLNTELRIFALMRMGINENEKIAEILNYSINTIYSYKTKIRNKAMMSKEDFDKKIMEITTLSS